MGFLDHINRVLHSKINFTSLKITNRNLLNPENKTLQRTNLNNDIFQSENEVEKIGLTPKSFVNPAISKPGLIKSKDYEEYLSFIQRYANIISLTNAINKNPNIKRILEENGLECNLQIENLNSIIDSHLIPCAQTVGIMYKKLGHKKDEQDYQNLIQAALLHDIGKVFIPKEILNKKGRLSKTEREIVELHNKLSYEILKTTDLDPKVAQLALEHHDYEGNITRSVENQLLTIADCYCALRENRPYKKAMNDIAAKTILYDMGTKGNFDTRYINYINAA